MLHLKRRELIVLLICLCLEIIKLHKHAGEAEPVVLKELLCISF